MSRKMPLTFVIIDICGITLMAIMIILSVFKPSWVREFLWMASIHYHSFNCLEVAPSWLSSLSDLMLLFHSMFSKAGIELDYTNSGKVRKYLPFYPGDQVIIVSCIYFSIVFSCSLFQSSTAKILSSGQTLHINVTILVSYIS